MNITTDNKTLKKDNTPRRKNYKVVSNQDINSIINNQKKLTSCYLSTKAEKINADLQSLRFIFYYDKITILC